MLQNIDEYHEQQPEADIHSIREVAPDLNTALNTINIVITGVMGAGKTFYMVNEAIPLSHLSSVHLVIFVSRKDDDDTVIPNLPLFGCPVEIVEYDDAQEEIMEVIEGKRCYNYLRRKLEEAGALDEWRSHFDEENMEKLEDKVFDPLKINDFSQPFLDTIIIFDDVGSTGLFKPGSYIATHMSIARDDLCTYFLATHETSDLDPKIKSKARTFVLLRGIPRQRLAIIRREIAIPITWEEFIDAYNQFLESGAHYMVMNNQTQSINFEN
jgi:hypothetical protein